jgi:hypothetical protein
MVSRLKVLTIDEYINNARELLRLVGSSFIPCKQITIFISKMNRSRKPFMI